VQVSEKLAYELQGGTMDCLSVNTSRVIGSRVLFGALVLGVTLVGGLSQGAGQRLPTPPQSQEPLPTPTQANSNSLPDLRSGGVIEESYRYHRQPPTAGTLQPMRSCIEAGGIPQANGWYNYGFPMQSYRYGWFGAERHDPRVFWTKGYYSDELRTAYRRSY